MKILQSNRILILGNSITLHPPAPEVGWDGNWGMAASAPENDYVHLLLARFTQAAGHEPESLVANIADFEREFATYDVAGGFAKYAEFRPDLLILAVGENIPAPSTESESLALGQALNGLLALFQSHGAPTIVVRSSFWPDSTKDAVLSAVCATAGGIFVPIGTLAQDPDNFARAEREFENEGVAAHPGDRGMAEIAKALWNAIAGTD